VLFPGVRWRQQVSAVYDLIEHGGPRQPPMADDGPWRTIAAEVNAWPGTAVISMEFLGPRNKQQIERIKQSFPDTDLQVVMTVRDLGRTIPAMWQESVQNGGVVTWEDFLDAVRAEKTGQAGPAKWFWRHQRAGAMSRRWVDAVGSDHFTLITVPPKGAPSSLLWERFAQVAGIAPDSCRLDVLANPSIGAASALVMRHLNEAMADRPMNKRVYHNYVKHALAKRGLVDRQKAEPVLGLDAKWVRKRGAVEVERLQSQKLHVVGDLDELLPQPVPGVHTSEIGAEEQLAAAVDGLAHVLRQWAASDRSHRRQLRELRKEA